MGDHRSVELGLFALTRVEHAGTGWVQCPVGLRRELQEWIERRGPGPSELERIADLPVFGGQTTNELVERVVALVEAGQVELDWRVFGHSDMLTAPPEPVPMSAHDVVAPPAVEPAVPEPAVQESKTSQAQVQTMLLAAQRGTPFCEVCELPSREAERKAASAADEARAATLVRAAAQGTAFCEECSR